ncbi:hypothetical protein ACJMK2_024724 [Sinanodonta woodiana]|uniref:RRM domain-containing protein n=1 Tax=Sinanodonta woodiana TaxID=1069815 RepID=A0ABD3XI49_SINWO
MAEVNPNQNKEDYYEQPYDQGGDLSDYPEELESNEEVDQQSGKQMFYIVKNKVHSDLDGTLKESNDLQKLLDRGIDESVAEELLWIFKTEDIVFDDLDEAARKQMKTFSLDDVKLMITLILNSDVEYAVNKSAYLCYQMKVFIRNKCFYTDPSGSLPGPDKEKLREILKETGYSLEIIPGYRKYGGPPPSYEGGLPRHGHEVNVGSIPKDWFEDKLVPLFQKFGTIYEIRLPIDIKSGYNKRYCFVSYCNKDSAQSACCVLKKFETRQGKKLRTNIRNTSTCLYVGKTPMYMSAEELHKDFEKITPGIKDVSVYCTPEMQENNLKNKGYCFVEYEDHRQASTAKENLKKDGSSLFGHDIIVHWAEPRAELDDEFMSKVKVVFVKNISRCTKPDTVETWFERFGKIEKVHLAKGYGFVHFENREDAMRAIEEMNGRFYGKCIIECSLSRSRDSTGRNQYSRRDRLYGGVTRVHRSHGAKRCRGRGGGSALIREINN